MPYRETPLETRFAVPCGVDLRGLDDGKIGFCAVEMGLVRIPDGNYSHLEKYAQTPSRWIFWGKNGLGFWPWKVKAVCIYPLWWDFWANPHT